LLPSRQRRVSWNPVPPQIGERGIGSFHFWSIFVSKLHQPRQGWGRINVQLLGPDVPEREREWKSEK